MMEAAGGTGSLAITTLPECTWSASTNANWISALSPASGQGTGDVSFRVAANEGSSSRDGTIAVNGEQARVSQRAPCRYDLGPSTQNVGANGGILTVTIGTASDCTWTAVAEVNWISLTSPATGSGTGTVAFLVAANDGALRTGAVSVGGLRSLVTQAAAPGPPPPPGPPSPPPPPPPPACTYALSPTIDGAPANDGAGTVNVLTTSTCAWTAASNASWLTISSGSPGTGNGRVEYRFTVNSTGRPRTGTLTIAGLTFTVVQAATPGASALSR